MFIIGWALIGLAVILGVIAIVMYILLLVKLFKHGGVGLGILGLFCSPFTYIWGWMKCGEFGFKSLMVWLTILLLIASLLGGAGSGLAAGSPEGKKALEDASKTETRLNGGY
ncbi:MAG TPA: hypothetical protein VLE43_04335 [Candidatus Saccharimonadia bacterium]|nr:hypothetical protein [Candidatus Saccharimonadia bacterium]